MNLNREQRNFERECAMEELNAYFSPGNGSEGKSILENMTIALNRSSIPCSRIDPERAESVVRFFMDEGLLGDSRYSQESMLNQIYGDKAVRAMDDKAVQTKYCELLTNAVRAHMEEAAKKLSPREENHRNFKAFCENHKSVSGNKFEVQRHPPEKGKGRGK